MSKVSQGKSVTNLGTPNLSQAIPPVLFNSLEYCRFLFSPAILDPLAEHEYLGFFLRKEAFQKAHRDRRFRTYHNLCPCAVQSLICARRELISRKRITTRRLEATSPRGSQSTNVRLSIFGRIDAFRPAWFKICTSIKRLVR